MRGPYDRGLALSSGRGIKYSHTIGMATNYGPGFYHPVDVVLGRDDTLFVLSRAVEGTASFVSRKRFTVCTVGEDYLGEFSEMGAGDGQIVWPVCAAIDRNDNIYVSDEALHRISIFDKDGRFQGKWGVKGSGNGEFDGPTGIAFDRDNNLLVVDGLNNRVQRYTSEGYYLGGWGEAGSGDGEFNLPWGIAVDGSGNIYVADWRNDRVQKFDSQGLHLATWGTSGEGDGEFHRPSGVAIDEEGDIYVADWGNERVQVLDAHGNFITKLRGEATLSKWAQQYFSTNPVEMRERQKAELEDERDPMRFDSLEEESAAVEKLFWGPISIKVDHLGRIFVVDSRRHRIQVYRKEGRVNSD